MKTQTGYAHAFLIIGLIALLIGALSLVFNKQVIRSSELGRTPSVKPKELSKPPKEVKFKEYTSISGSGLTFTYPDSWTLLPAEKVNDFGGRFKTATSMLFSQAPNPSQAKLEVPKDNICVTFTEISGNASYSAKMSDRMVTNGEFTVGSSKVALFENEVDNEGYSGHLMSVDPKSIHGASYVALNHDYFLYATSQKNCRTTDNPTKRDVNKEIEESRTILKSVKLVD